MFGFPGTALGSHGIAWILAVGVLLSTAQAAGHGHGLVPGPEASSIAARLIHGEGPASLDEGCALCRNRLQEREFALRLETLGAPHRSAGARIPARCDRHTSLRCALADLARAPPHHA